MLQLISQYAAQIVSIISLIIVLFNMYRTSKLDGVKIKRLQTDSEGEIKGIKANIKKINIAIKKSYLSLASRIKECQKKYDSTNDVVEEKIRRLNESRESINISIAEMKTNYSTHLDRLNKLESRVNDDIVTTLKNISSQIDN
jgi:hypothetical protein